MTQALKEMLMPALKSIVKRMEEFPFLLSGGDGKLGALGVGVGHDAV